LATIDMTLDRQGRPQVVASMEGKDLPMLIDTGSTYSMVTRQTVDQLGLRPQHLPQNLFHMVSGEGITSMASAHNLRIGKLTADRFPFLILPYGWDDPAMAGLIAADMLSSYDLEFDFEAMKLHLMSPQHCAGQVVYWTKQPYMALPIRVDENRLIHLA